MSTKLGGRLYALRFNATAWGHKELSDEFRQLEWRLMDTLAKGGKVQECECALENLCHRLDDQILRLCKMLVEVA
jgi:hypothetical protein